MVPKNWFLKIDNWIQKYRKEYEIHLSDQTIIECGIPNCFEID
jgi:hypothetical protein